MLIGEWEGHRILAGSAMKGFAYACPECGGELTLRQGSVVVHHFAHKASGTGCSYAAGETVAHMKGKQLLHDAFARRGLRVEVECRVLTDEGDRRADVLVWGRDGKSRVAFEVQHSYISPWDLARRTRAYMSAGVRVIWVPLASWEDDWPRWFGWVHAYQRWVPVLDIRKEVVHLCTLKGGEWRREFKRPHRLDDLRIEAFEGAGALRRTYTVPKGPSARLVDAFFAMA